MTSMTIVYLNCEIYALKLLTKMVMYLYGRDNMKATTGSIKTILQGCSISLRIIQCESTTASAENAPNNKARGFLGPLLTALGDPKQCYSLTPGWVADFSYLIDLNQTLKPGLVVSPSQHHSEATAVPATAASALLLYSSSSRSSLAFWMAFSSSRLSLTPALSQYCSMSSSRAL
ncbi:hypothetical protein FGO68_gene1909 [Halteria grandinella]|uniref:Uncharacterized protein n=1 Tax=Halteria grandinella TaxID=5974 RepID=A0A8J8T047_HALGN|nr:hypothetical protein FGO68_gene1909 [Halteria grandinella]